MKLFKQIIFIVLFGIGFLLTINLYRSNQNNGKIVSQQNNNQKKKKSAKEKEVKKKKKSGSRTRTYTPPKKDK
tara:strand:+ start:117 stop:335 length:219 start_codon:yes stop_codon:yes gene_type:complete